MSDCGIPDPRSEKISGSPDTRYPTHVTYVIEEMGRRWRDAIPRLLPSHIDAVVTGAGHQYTESPTDFTAWREKLESHYGWTQDTALTRATSGKSGTFIREEMRGEIKDREGNSLEIESVLSIIWKKKNGPLSTTFEQDPKAFDTIPALTVTIRGTLTPEPKDGADTEPSEGDDSGLPKYHFEIVEIKLKDLWEPE